MKSWVFRKGFNAGKYWGQEEKGVTEDEMFRWHLQLNGYEFEQALGNGEGQGSLVCCSPWGCKQADTTEQLNRGNNLPVSDGTGCHDLSFRILSFRPAFSLSSFVLIKRLFSSLHFLPLELYHLLICGCWYFSWQPWFQAELYPAQHFTWCILQWRQIIRLTIYIPDVVLSQCWTSSFFQVCF